MGIVPLGSGSASGTVGLPFATAGVPGTSYPAAQYGGDINLALKTAFAAGYRHILISGGGKPTTFSALTNFDPNDTAWLIEGEGESIVTIQVAAGVGVCWGGQVSTNYVNAEVRNLTFDATNVTASSSSSPTVTTNVAFAPGVNCYLFTSAVVAGLSAATRNGTGVFTGAGGQAGIAVLQQMLFNGLYIAAADSWVFTFTGSPTFTQWGANELINFLTPKYLGGTETRNPVDMEEVSWSGTSNGHMNVPVDGSEGVGMNLSGCENSSIRYCTFQTQCAFVADCYNGAVRPLHTDFNQLAISGVHVAPIKCAPGNGGVILSSNGPNGYQIADFPAEYFNGGDATHASLVVNTATHIQVNLFGFFTGGGASQYITGTGLGNASFKFYGVLFAPGALAAGTAFFASAPLWVSGDFLINSSGTGTVAQVMANATLGDVIATRGATTVRWLNGNVLLGDNVLGYPAQEKNVKAQSLTTISGEIGTAFTPTANGLVLVVVELTCSANTDATGPVVTVSTTDAGSAATSTETWNAGVMAAGASLTRIFLVNATAAVAIATHAKLTTSGTVLASKTILAL